MTLKALRPKESGVGLSFAILQQVIFFWGVPMIASRYWPIFLHLKEEFKVGFAAVMAITVFTI